jgi:probable F420-dependent oxidoreductase
MNRPHFGVSLPQVDASWLDVRRAAEQLESLGFDSLWVSDHMQLPYGGADDTPMLEAFAELAAVAVVTDRIELGTNCSNIMFRNPGVLAKQVATIDQIAGGRIIPGLGAGYFTPEFIAYGCPPWRQWQRVEALAEAVEIVRALWTGERVTYEGKYFQLRNAVALPRPARRPPLLIGGASTTTLRAAALHADIWNNPPLYEGRLAANIERLREFAQQASRDPDELVCSQRARVALAESPKEADKLLAKMGAKIGEPAMREVEAHGIWGSPERVCECIERYLALGCSHFVIDFYSPDRAAAAELFARRVMPEFR